MPIKSLRLPFPVLCPVFHPVFTPVLADVTYVPDRRPQLQIQVTGDISPSFPMPILPLPEINDLVYVLVIDPAGHAAG